MPSPLRILLFVLTASIAVPSAECHSSGLTTLSFPDGKHTFYVDTNQHIDQMWWNGSAWFNQDLTTMIGAPVAIAGSALTSYSVSDGQHIYYIASNQHVDQLWWNGSAWSYQDVTANANGSVAAPGSDLSSYVSPDGHHVFYVATNRHVDQLWWTGSTWGSQDLTVFAGTTLAVPGSALTNFVISGGVHICYIDLNQHVNQLWWTGSTWANQDLTAGTVAPPVAAGSGLTSYSVSDGQHVYYIASNQHVDQLWWTGSAWGNQDITAAAHGTLASAGSDLSNYLGPDGQHVFYIDVNQHVGQLWWTGSSEVYQDLTGGNPLASAQSSLTNFSLSDGLHVVYADFSRNVNQLWQAGSSYANQNLTAGLNGLPLTTIFNITGSWQQASQYAASWQLTQNGNAVSGTATSSAGASCGSITWQASGQLTDPTAGTYSLTALNPSASTDLCGNESASQQLESLTLAPTNNTVVSDDESIFSAGSVSGQSSWTKVGANNTVSIAGSQGVPLQGSSVYSVTLASSGSITLTISNNGSGAATFGNGSTTMTITQSTNVTVKGNTVSGTANDISITATSPTNPGVFARLYVSVVSVTITMRNSGSFSSDDTAANASFTSDFGSSLGAHVVPGGPGGPYCAEVLEYVGTVSPTNYKGIIALTRTISFATFVNTQQVDSRSNQDDTSDAGLTVTTPTAQGHVFDLDVPGVYPVAGQSNNIARQRQNFNEKATLDSPSGPLVASSSVYARTSCTGALSNPVFSFDVAGDNSSGIGATKLTWNLQ